MYMHQVTHVMKVLAQSFLLQQRLGKASILISQLPSFALEIIGTYVKIPQIYRTAREYQRFIELERENAKNLSNCKGIPKNDWNQERKDNKLIQQIDRNLWYDCECHLISGNMMVVTGYIFLSQSSSEIGPTPSAFTSCNLGKAIWRLQHQNIINNDSKCFLSTNSSKVPPCHSCTTSRG